MIKYDKLQQLSDYGRMIQKDNSHIGTTWSDFVIVEQTMDDYTNLKDDITNLFRNVLIDSWNNV